MLAILIACAVSDPSVAPRLVVEHVPMVPSVPGESCADDDLGADCDAVTSCCRYTDRSDLDTYDCRLILDEIVIACTGINCGYAVLLISPYACPT